MATAKENGKIVLAGIIPNRIDLLDQARRELSIIHFVDPIHAKFFQFLEHYSGVAGAVLTKNALDDILNRSTADPGRKAIYTETFDDLLATKVLDSDFLWSVYELRESAAEKATKDALTQSMEIILKGVTDSHGETIKGHEPARLHLLESFADIDRELSKQEAPQGDMRNEEAQILAEYAARKTARADGTSQGINFGIDELDRKLGGLQQGELVLIAAFSSDGKSSMSVQLAWNAVVEQGKNVLFLTTETVNTVIRRKLIARHSKHPRFASHELAEGLNTRDLKAGTLSDSQETLFQEVVRDFSRNPDHGRLYIAQVPRMATLETAESIMMRTQKLFNIDLVVCDYLALFRSTGHRTTDRESYSGILKEAKQLTTTFNRGAGVPFVSPWQVNRTSRESAEKLGQYTSASLAETAEATNAQPMSAQILTPSGWSTMGQMEIGTSLVAPEGGASSVLGIFPKGEQDVYKVTFKDGVVVEASEDHLWRVRTKKNHRLSTGGWRTFTTAEVLRRMTETKTNTWAIPVIQPTAYTPEHPVTPLIDPYLLGILIGDGCLSDRSSSVRVTTGDADLIDRIQEVLPDYEQVHATTLKWGGWVINFSRRGSQGKSSRFISELRELGMMCGSPQKRLPDDWLSYRYEDRLSLLQGLMDTDGRTGRSPSFDSSSVGLVGDVTELVRSLGGIASARAPRASHLRGVRKLDSHGVRIRMPAGTVLFRLRRKWAAQRKWLAEEPVRWIKSIDFSHREQVQCIKVSAPSHLYVTDGWTVTHNSADVIISILAPTDNTNRYAAITGQILKNRDGETANGLQIDVDFGTSFFRSRASFGSIGAGSFFGVQNGPSGLDSLLD